MMMSVRISILVGASILLSTAVASAQQKSSEPKTCSEAFFACKNQNQPVADCRTELDWCKKTGTFADPKTKSVSMGLQKK
jgi:hypothetical protein